MNPPPLPIGVKIYAFKEEVFTSNSREMLSPRAQVPVPRGGGERAIAGLLAVLFGFLGTACFLFVHSWTPETFRDQLFKAVVEHVFISVAGICLAVIIWSLFTPSWMERLIVRVQSRIVETLLVVIALSAVAIFAALVLQ